MRTVIIYDQCGLEDVKFYVVDGDHSTLNGTYVNSSEDESLWQELMLILNKSDMQSTFPVDEVKNGAKVIVCGFAP